ncbi:TolB family protein [Streptomyces sp. NPDC059398]|uniref:TolB family protein n=1 Tax=Streptomyces sp. NPDC059398 TaxID=3346820 RepID=UPI0036C89222
MSTWDNPRSCSRMGTGARTLILVVTALVLATAATGYVMHARDGAAAGPAGRIRLDRPGRILFRDTAPGAGFGRAATVSAAAPGAARTVGAVRCDRLYAARGTGICLQRKGPVPATYVGVLDRAMHPTRRIKAAGFPNRARVSASGAMLSWTTFVQGDSYLRDDFSTRTSVLDTRTGRLRSNIERIPLTLGGRPYHAADVNYWGVTFAADDNTFYATVRTGGRTYLVRGDYRKWTARTLRTNAECPSLSPDGTRIVFKKRVNASANRPWRLYVLDLATMRETPLAEVHSIDDQAAWLDGHTVMYGRARGSGGGWDVWSVPADGSGAPRLLIPDATSPAVLTGER